MLLVAIPVTAVAAETETETPDPLTAGLNKVLALDNLADTTNNVAGSDATCADSYSYYGSVDSETGVVSYTAPTVPLNRARSYMRKTSLELNNDSQYTITFNISLAERAPWRTLFHFVFTGAAGDGDYTERMDSSAQGIWHRGTSYVGATLGYREVGGGAPQWFYGAEQVDDTVDICTNGLTNAVTIVLNGPLVSYYVNGTFVGTFDLSINPTSVTNGSVLPTNGNYYTSDTLWLGLIMAKDQNTQNVFKMTDIAVYEGVSAEVLNTTNMYAQATAPAENKVDVRFLATLNTLNLDGVSFKVTATLNGVDHVLNNGGAIAVTEVYSAINATESGSVKSVKATAVDGLYLAAVEVLGVPAEATDTVVFTVEYYQTPVGGEATLIDTATVTVIAGVVQQ